MQKLRSWDRRHGARSLFNVEFTAFSVSLINSAPLVCCSSAALTPDLVEVMTAETTEIITDSSRSSMVQMKVMCYCATAWFGSSSSASQQW